MLRTILIVDDSAVHRQMLGLLLKRLAAVSLGLRFARDGRDALAILDTCPDIDLIILDLHMPHMGGLEFLHRLRLDPARQATPVIVVSTANHPETIASAFAAGANAYLSKPFRSQELEHLVRPYAERNDGRGNLQPSP